MKGKSRLKVIYIAIIVVTFMPVLLGVNVKGKLSNKLIGKYVSIGDINEFKNEEVNGLYNSLSYSDLIKEFLLSMNPNLDCYNLNKVAMTSNEMMNLIKENKDSIKNSDLITISIGLGNVFNSIFKVLNKNLDSNDFHNLNQVQFTDKTSELLDEEMKNEIIKHVDSFKDEFIKSINHTRELSKDADIYINTIYNPISKESESYGFFEEQISLINNVIIGESKNYNYKVIDAYSMFDDDKKWTVDAEDGMLNIYPSSVGHAIIANEVISNYEEYVELDIKKITVDSENIKGKTIPNTNVIIVLDNGIVERAKTDKEGEFKIDIPTLDIGTNIEVLVYDKSIFSILYKSQKIVV